MQMSRQPQSEARARHRSGHHEHRSVAGGWDGAHRHQICSECGHMLCATSRSTREELQTREVTGLVVGVISRIRGAEPVVGQGLQLRTLRIVTERCGRKTRTVVEATPWR
jgi:hypothetical protein